MSIALDDELATQTRPWLESSSPPWDQDPGGQRDESPLGLFRVTGMLVVCITSFLLNLADDIVVVCRVFGCLRNQSTPHTFPLAASSSSSSTFYSPNTIRSIPTPILPTNDSPVAPSESLTTYRIRPHHIRQEIRKTLTSGT
jgi:hypothetical protein